MGGIKQALVATDDQQIAGVSMPAAVDGGNGAYYQDRFFDWESDSVLPSLYENLWVVISHALAISAKIEYVYAPSALSSDNGRRAFQVQ